MRPILRGGSWRVPSLGQLFDPGLDQQTSTALTTEPSSDPSLVPDRPRAPAATMPTSVVTTAPTNGNGNGAKPSNLKYYLIGGAGLVVILGIGAAVVLSDDKPKRKRKRNPLAAGYSQKTVLKNIAKLSREGYGCAQASAIALRSARAAYRKRHPRGALPLHLKRKRKQA